MTKKVETVDIWEGCKSIERIPGKVSGTWLFEGTRMPVATLFAIFKSGNSLAEFHEWYPGVEEGLVLDLLEHIELSLEDRLVSS